MNNSFWDTLCADAAAAESPLKQTSSIFSRVLQVRRAMRHRPGFACVFWLRVNQLMIRKRWRGSHRLRVWRQYRFGNDISPYAQIGPGLFLPHYVDVTVGASATIGKNATLYNGSTVVGLEESGLPRLGDNVTVYTGAKIIAPVTIGDGAVIGALSLCRKDVPAHHVFYGIPPNITIKPL